MPYPMAAVRGSTTVMSAGPAAASLTLPLGLPLGDTSAYVGWTSNSAVGTVYWVVTTSATPPTAQQVKDGEDHTGAAASAAGNQAAGTGAQAATATGLSSNTAYYAYRVQDTGVDSNVLAGVVLTTLTTGTSDTSFDTLVAAMTTPPADLRKGYVAQMIGALYAGSVWSKLSFLHVIAAADSQAGYLNWISPSTFTLTAVNSPTFTADRGVAGNGTTSYVDLGWDPATDGGALFLQDSAHIGSYVRTTDGSGLSGFGTGTAALVLVRNNSGAGGRMNTSGPLAGSSGGSFPQHAVMVRRISTEQLIFKDGVQTGTGANGTVALSSSDLNAGRVNTTTFSSAEYAVLHGGAALSDAEVTACYNALNAYMVAVGADT